MTIEQAVEQYILTKKKIKGIDELIKRLGAESRYITKDDIWDIQDLLLELKEKLKNDLKREFKLEEERKC